MARTIKADGRTITVPDDATPDEINQIVGPAPNNGTVIQPATSVSGARGYRPPKPQFSTDPSGRTPTGEPQPGETRNVLQRALDNMVTPDPRKEEWQSPLRTGVDRFSQGVAENFLPLISHPVKSAGAILHSVGSAIAEGHGDSTATAYAFGRPIIEHGVSDYLENGPQKAVPHMVGQLLGGAASSELGGAALRTAGEAGRALRTAAIGDPDVAAIRAAGVPKKAALRFKSDVQGARPFLTGAKSVEDVQNIAGLGGSARDEIYKPISDFLSEHGNRVVQGPDGPTTLQALEDEREMTSAQLRQLKAGGPEGIALATQKGLTQADLLARQQALERWLDPHLMGAGIDSPLIRQTYGQVARVGDQFAGRLTDAEKTTPYGFGRMLNMRIDNPRSWIGAPVQGARDLLAGHPLWSGNAGDVGVSDAFRTGGPKPDFRAPVSSMPPWENPPRLLEANVPGNAGYGDVDVGSMAGTPHPGPQVTPPLNVRGMLPETASEPNYMRRYVEPPEPSTIRPMPPEQRLLLPAQAGPGETQPYIAYRTMPAGVSGETTRIAPPRFALRGEILSPSGRIAYPPLPEGAEGPTIGLRPQPRGLLPGAQETVLAPPENDLHIYPPGSQFRNLGVDSPQYPAGSQFRAPIKPFDIDEYLKSQTKPLQGAQ